MDMSSKKESLEKDSKQSQHNIAINEERLIQLSRKLTHLMEEEQLFKDPLLKIETLSEKLRTPGYIISQVLRFGLQTNFNKFVSLYRVRYVTEKLQEVDRSNDSILDIALEAGFNSKSSFNQTFKKMTNQTPSQFRQEKLSQ